MTRTAWEIFGTCPSCGVLCLGQRSDVDRETGGPWCYICGGNAMPVHRSPDAKWRFAEVLAAVQMLCPQNLEEETLEEEGVTHGVG